MNWWLLGDGRCDSAANNEACNFDNGDCCAHTCEGGVGFDTNYGTSYPGYGCGCGQYASDDDCDESSDEESNSNYNCLPSCNVPNPDYLGNGYCDKTDGYNTAECNYDNGDCCEDSCMDGDYSCGINGYECLDETPNWCTRDQCGNECFGLCGWGCECWEWACGDCHCHGECSEHDSYCSCSSLWHYWCINIFWVNCNDGSIAVL